MTDPFERAAVLLTLIRELQAVMQRENALLRDMQLARLEDLASAKATLAEAYEREVRSLRAAPQVVGALPAEARIVLEQATRDLQAVQRTNLHALEAAKAVVESILQRLGDSLAAHERRGAPYASPGSPQGEARGRVIAVAFDRRV